MVELKIKEKWDDFVSSTHRILTVSKKPDTPQFINMARITALGLLVLGALGYAVELISFYLRTSL